MRIFIGCSASDNIPKKYIKDCKQLVEKLMIGNDLVFGACYAGLMGVSYDAAKSNKRSVIGVCPERYVEDFETLDCDEEYVAETISKRTEMLFDQSDALIFLPGGIGTLHEFFSAIECKKCHEFDKPIVLYNCNGFYDDILKMMNKQLNENFYRPNDMIPFVVKNDAYEILSYINLYKCEDDILYNKAKVRKIK